MYAKKYHIFTAKLIRKELELLAKADACILMQERPEKEPDGRSPGCIGTVYVESAWLLG